jgi:hypothetical protein
MIQVTITHEQYEDSKSRKMRIGHEFLSVLLESLYLLIISRYITNQNYPTTRSGQG